MSIFPIIPTAHPSTLAYLLCDIFGGEVTFFSIDYLTWTNHDTKISFRLGRNIPSFEVGVSNLQNFTNHLKTLTDISCIFSGRDKEGFDVALLKGQAVLLRLNVALEN